MLSTDVLICFSVLLWSLLVEGEDVRILESFTTTPMTSHLQIGGHNFFIPGRGVNLNLTCESDTVNAALNWTRTKSWPSGPELLGRAGVSGSSIFFNPVKPDDGGRYNCSVGTGNASYYLNVLHEASVVTKNEITNGTLRLVHLRCEQRFSWKFPLIWRYLEDGQWKILNTPIEGDHNYTVNAKDDYALEVRSYHGRFPLKTGQYECELNTTGTAAANITIKKRILYEAKPDVRIDGSSSSRTAIKDDSFSVTCVYSGASPDDQVQWEVLINATSRDPPAPEERPRRTIVAFDDLLVDCPVANHPDRKCLPNEQHYTLNRDMQMENKTEGRERTSVLEIHKVQEPDRGQYYCFVKNIHGENGATAFVRVKDRWAAMWPFLGIVAEIILLALIICACERRRSRLTDQTEEQKPLTTQKPEEERNTMPADNAVRNRK